MLTSYSLLLRLNGMDAREKKDPSLWRFPLDTIAKPRTKQGAILLSHSRDHSTSVANDTEMRKRKKKD